jgi:hypothetical protein
VPNLERARKKIESFMTDNCTITRDVEGVYDDALDEFTGTLGIIDPDSVTIWSGGALVLSAGIGRNEGAQGQPVELLPKRTYRCYIPRSVTTVAVHDVLVVTSSLRDPDLVGRSFIVRGVYAETFAIARELDLEGEK